MRRALPAALALALAAAAPAAAEEQQWVTWDSPYDGYVGLSPYRPDFAVLFDRGRRWQPVVWQADNMTVAELGARGCLAQADAARGTLVGRSCPANLTIDATDGPEGLVVFVRRVDGLGAPGQRLGPE